MIKGITISYNLNGIHHTLEIPDHDMSLENLPYDMAEAVSVLIKESSINENILIKCLIDEFGYQEEEQ